MPGAFDSEGAGKKRESTDARGKTQLGNSFPTFRRQSSRKRQGRKAKAGRPGEERRSDRNVMQTRQEGEAL